VNRVGDDANLFYHSGDSMLIHPMGNILFQKVDEEDVYTAILSKDEVEKTRRSLPFLADKDDFTLN
jgi:predicted amidohydrolase